jgi:cytochrome c
MSALRKLLLLVLIFSFAGLASANDRGTPDQAVALVKKAIAYYKANGKEKVAAEINGKTGMFEEKDLYLFMSPVEPGPVVAHAANPKLIGRALSDLRDIDGVYFTRRFREVAAKDGKGWVEYKWPNAKTGVMEAKRTYIERVDDYYFACGVYREMPK